jgi:hypothetical protein
MASGAYNEVVIGVFGGIEGVDCVRFKDITFRGVKFVRLPRCTGRLLAK